MVNSNINSYIAKKYLFFEDIRKSDVGKITKNVALNLTYFSRSPSPKIIQNGQEFMEKSQICDKFFFSTKKERKGMDSWKAFKFD